MATATDLITESATTNQIVNVTVDADEAATLMGDLSAECEDNVDANDGVTEFWGTTDEGSEWRVHVRTTHA